METNDTVTAPQSSDVNAAYEEWSRKNYGSRDEFYWFLTNPSAERDAFLCDEKATVHGNIISLTL